MVLDDFMESFPPSDLVFIKLFKDMLNPDEKSRPDLLSVTKSLEKAGLPTDKLNSRLLTLLSRYTYKIEHSYVNYSMTAFKDANHLQSIYLNSSFGVADLLVVPNNDY